MFVVQWNNLATQWVNFVAQWDNSVDYLENISDLLEGVGAKGVQIVAQAEGTVGVDAFEGGCEVALGITIAGGDAETVETTDVGGLKIDKGIRCCRFQIPDSIDNAGL